MRRIKVKCSHAMAGLLVLVTVLAGCAAPALAALQVSNLGQGTDTETMNASWDAELQGFETGTHQAGYSLTSVQLHIDSFVTPATIDDMTISLRARPQSFDLRTFVNPTFTSGTVTFTLPADTTFDLTPETRYFVVIDVNTSDDMGGVVIGTTTVPDEDSGAAAGWEISNDSLWNDSGSWMPNAYMYRIAVDATLKNTPATGLPTITGTAAAVGDMLTALTTGISDVDGLTNVSYGYQWIQVDDMAVETDISGATSSTYTLVAATVGKHFKVRVTFQDDAGFDESRKSKLYPARTGGICNRTEQVRDAIMAATTATTCANVTAMHLSGLGVLNLSDQSISSLQSGDFAGLTGLTRLWLQDNTLSSLPANIFDGLTALNWLRLQDNDLSSLRADSFAGLTALKQLDLSDNDLSSLPANIFDGLTALERLTLQNNGLTSLRANSFAGLTALRTLTLSDNALTLSGLPAGLFAGLTALVNLVLANNDTLTGLPAGLFTGLTALEDLNLSYNALSSLPAGIFDGLTALHTLRLNRNALTSLPANVFQDLTTLTVLELHNNPNTDPFAPTAEAGETQMVATGATVTLAGSSSGPWGTNVTYAWTPGTTLTGADTASPSFTAPSTAGDLVFTLTVKGRPAGARGTANDTDTVTVTVTDPATLATLSDLTLSVGVLDPEFDTEKVTYTASVLNDVTTLTVTPTTTGSNATVEYLDDSDTALTDTDSTAPGLQVALAPNLAETTHVIKVKVTAETGTPKATKTYTLTVTKEASDVQLPGAPTGLTATPAVEPTQIDLSWTVPDDDGNDDGNSDITGYRIEVSTDGNAWTVLEENTRNTDTTYAHTGLDPGDTRHYRVSAHNVIGHGPSNTDQATTLSGGICARTAQVRDAIVEEVMKKDSSVTTCADVTPAHLTRLDSALDLTSKNITSLKPGDFAGLTNLYDLQLERNALTELPAGIFDPLTTLAFLRLDDNALTSLPPGIFDKLTALVFLDLSGNALTSLPPGIFDKLTALTRLNLCGNSLTELELPSFLYDSFITNPPTNFKPLCLDVNVVVKRAVTAIIEAVAGTVIEGEPARFRVRLSRPGATTVTVRLDGRETERMVSGNTTVSRTFLRGRVEQIVEIATDDDDWREAASELTMRVVPGREDYTVGEPATATVRIEDNDQGVVRTPDVPQRVEAIPGNGQATLVWEPPHSNGGSDITDYEYRARHTSPFEAAGTTGAAGTPDEWVSMDRARSSYVVSNLDNDAQGQVTVYVFQLRAVNAKGAGDPSREARARPMSKYAQRPGSPRHLTAVGNADGSVTLHWEAPVTDGGSKITHYEYIAEESFRAREGPAVHTTVTWASTGSNEPEVTVSHRNGSGPTSGEVLSGGVTYAFAVRTVNAKGPSPLFSNRAWAAEPAAQTAAQETEETPLTARVEAAPAGHDGETPFTLRLVLSEPVRNSYRAVRDAAFEVTGGTVTRARRVDGRSDLWEVTVAPQGGEAVRIALPGDRACGTPGALCTADGRAVSTPLLLLVPGPARDDVAPDRPAPLTARFATVPGEHDGATAFTVEIVFGEAPSGMKNRTLRNALRVTGGAVTRVRQVNHVPAHRIVTVQPAGHDAVDIALPASPDCEAAGAICTEAGGRLETALLTRVRGPAALSVADAEVHEGPGAVLAFAVTLDRATSAAVSVDYATSDGTATAGSDYTATSGTLTFAAGETSKTVSVAVLDDAHDEGSETLTLTLSNPSGAYSKDGTATGTIENSDPLPQAWLARFGRTVGMHVTDAVGERLRGSSGQESQVTVGGYRLPLGQPASGRAESETTREPETTTDRLASLLTGLVGRALGLGPTQPQGGGDGMDPWADRPESDPRLGQSQTLQLPTVRFRDVLLGSSFRLTLGDADTPPGHMRLTAWGRVAGTRVDGRDGDLTLDGDVLTGTVGVDGEWDRLLAGVAVAHSRGNGGYTMPGLDARGRGDLDTALTSLHPYLRYAVTERLDVWGMLGYGWGDLSLQPETDTTFETATTFLMGAFGGRGILLQASESGGFQLATRTDAMLTRTSSDAVTTGNGNLASSEADAHRLRVVLEGTRGFTWPEGRTLTPTLEVGLRHDWGDAETGFGVELGGRVHYADPRLGLTIEGAVRGLLAHEDNDYKEWGASGSVRIAPGQDGQGLSLTLSPTWGAASSGVDGLWSQQTTAGLAPQGTRAAPTGRLNAEIGYGVASPFGHGLLTPYAGTVLTDGAARTYRLGTRWTSVSGLTLNLEVQRQEPAGAQPVNQGLQLQVGWGF